MPHGEYCSGAYESRRRKSPVFHNICSRSAHGISNRRSGKTHELCSDNSRAGADANENSVRPGRWRRREEETGYRGCLSTNFDNNSAAREWRQTSRPSLLGESSRKKMMSKPRGNGDSDERRCASQFAHTFEQSSDQQRRSADRRHVYLLLQVTSFAGEVISCAGYLFVQVSIRLNIVVTISCVMPATAGIRLWPRQDSQRHRCHIHASRRENRFKSTSYSAGEIRRNTANASGIGITHHRKPQRLFYRRVALREPLKMD